MKKVALFLDAAKDLTLGLLTSEYRWSDYRIYEGKNHIGLLQSYIYQALAENNQGFDQVSTVFFSAGPGSYTGLRQVKIFCDLCALSQKEVFSFYHYRIPQMSGQKSGTWETYAYKGQNFSYTWSEEEEKQELLPKRECLDGITLSQKLLEEKSELIFPKIEEARSSQEIFYYRSLYEEFTPRSLPQSS